jgi:DNA-directed RNA polymerase specialized sigma24 family protein
VTNPTPEKKRGGRRVARSKRTKRKGFTRTASFDAAKSLAKVQRVLNPAQIEVLVWYYVDGMDMSDIGMLLGCGKKAVNHRLNVIDRKLRKARIRLPRRVEHPYATDSVSNYNVM